MKNYRALLPVLLIAFTILAIYNRLNELKGQEEQYYTYLESARNYREGKIYTDAWEQYNHALEMDNTLELCEEMAQMRLEENDGVEIRLWGEQIVEQYPKELFGYEYLIDYYYDEGKYKECFELYEIVQKRAIFSEGLAEKMNTIQYEYKLRNGRYTEVSEFVNDYSVYCDEGLYGYSTSAGKAKLKAIYQQAGAFNENRAPVQDENGEFYFIDEEGNRKMNVPKNIEITELGCLSESVYTVGTVGKMYYANMDGELILGPYEDATTFNYGKAAIKEDGLWYLIDVAGNKLSDGYLSFVADEKNTICRNNIIFAETEGGYICLDGQSERITNQVYEDARLFLDNTMAAVKKDGKWGFIDNTGEMKIEPKYEDAKSFRNGLAAVKKDGLWGYIDSDGIIAIQPIFQDAKCFNISGYTYVQPEGSDRWAVLELISNTYIY